jgi:L-ribulose-5-phosphate 3-epimerase
MKKALSQIIYGRNRDIEELLTQVKAWGYEGFELVYGADGAVPLDATEADYQRLREASEKTGVALVSICASGSGEGKLTDDDPAKRALRKDEIRKAIEAAQALSIDGILVVPGLVTPEVPYDVAYQRVIDEMRELAPTAEAAKVHVGIENVWNKLFTSPLDMRDAIDAVGSDCVGCFFDIGNFVFWSFPEQWIRILGTRIKKVHFKDFKFENMQCAFTQLGEGQVDWPAVMAALKEIGFDDYAISEVGGDDDVLAATSRILDDILTM